MNVRFGLTCLSLLISCWCCTTPSVSAASNGVRPRRQSRTATLNEYLIPPAPPNVHATRVPEFSRQPHNYHGGPQPPKGLQGFGPPASPSFRHGKILTPSPTEPPGYFARLMGWLNPFGSWQGSSAPQQQRPDNIPQRNLHSGYQQLSPIRNGYGAPAPPYNIPAPSYGPPIISQERHPSGKKFPYPPSPQGGQAYLPPEKTRNCNPCNQVPWIPLYNGINIEDARYAASSTNLAPPESSEPKPHQQQDNGDTTIYHLPSVSHEVKVPDFGYGSPSLSSAPDANHQASSSSAQLNINNNGYSDDNQNFKYAQTASKASFTGPIPNPHLYPGAMPPLFKAKPFGPKPQDINTSLNPPNIADDHSERHVSFHGGGTEAGNIDGINSGVSSSAPSLDPRAPFPGPQDYQDKKSSQLDALNSPFDNQYEQQAQNVGSFSPFHSSIDHQQSSSHEFAAAIDQGYVDELPPGAETVSPNPDGHFQPTSFNEDHDNGAANLDYLHTLHPSNDYRTQSTSTFGIGNSGLPIHEGSQEIAANSGNVRQSTNYDSQGFSNSQQVIHYEQSPIIDLSLGGIDERRKSSNDSSASSSTSTGTVEDPPVILQNEDGTYGINSTWPVEDSAKIEWPKDDGFKINISTVTASTLPRDGFSENRQSTNFQSFKASSIDNSATSSNFQESQPGVIRYSEHPPRNNSGHQGQYFDDSKIQNRTHEQNDHYEQNENIGDSRVEGQSNVSESPRKQSQDLLDLYPGLIRFEDSGSYGFKLPDPPAGSISEEPFLKALMKSYANFNKNSGQNDDHPPTLPGNRETWFDPRQINLAASFTPSQDHLQRLQTLVDAKLKPANRQEGAKRNKQVQIIIPYTSQYTPKPFHPVSDDWSAKTSPAQTQARKVPAYDTNNDYLAQETRRVKNKNSQILPPLKNSSRTKEIIVPSSAAKANTSIDVLRLQKNIDNWTIQEYSRGTTASTEVPTFSRPYLLPSKKIPSEYLTTTEPVVSAKNTVDETEKEIGDVLAGFSFNDLEHEGSASDHIDISHVQVSPHLNEVSSVFPKIMETTTSTSLITPTIEKDTWKELPVSISPLNKERVYVVTPQSVSTSPTTRRNKSYDKVEINEATKIPTKKQDFDRFESIERAYQVLPQAVNNLVVASTGPAIAPLWGIMEHEKYASKTNDSTPEIPVLYAGHSKVSHARQ